jgi:hypothetical protein
MIEVKRTLYNEFQHYNSKNKSNKKSLRKIPTTLLFQLEYPHPPIVWKIL